MAGVPPTSGPPPWIETLPGLCYIFAIGLLVRIAIARLSPGLWYDVTLFRHWSDRLLEIGPAHFYAPDAAVDVPADYPPGYLYVLLVLGKLSRVVLGHGPSVFILKLPAIAADLGMAALAVRLAGHLDPRRATTGFPIRAGTAAAILLNPAIIIVSSVWGQVDSVYGFLVLTGILLLATGRGRLREAAGVVVFAIAFATKPQTVLALPLIAVVLARRHLAAGGFTRRAWLSTAGRLAVFSVLGAAVISAMFWPFAIGPRGILGFYRNAGSVYQITSLFAFNVWGVFAFFRPEGGWEALTAFLAFAAASVALMTRGWRSLTRGANPEAVALFGAVAVTCAGFTLLTRMHERYLYLAVVGLAPFVMEQRFRRMLMIVSACVFLNVHFVYVYFALHSASPGDAWTVAPLFDAVFGTSRDAWQLKVWSGLVAVTCLTVATLGWRWLERPPATATPPA
jgi:Gpi18-like mannosyltransferase